MPSIITHHLFGTELYEELHETLGSSKAEADAFLLGNQGPDPLLYLFMNPFLLKERDLASRMHQEKTAELLAALPKAVSVLPREEQPIGRSWACGFWCHYALDSCVHPLVYAQTYALCDAGEPDLTLQDRYCVHDLIESEWDELMLWKKRNCTIASFNPAEEILIADTPVVHIVAKMCVFLALEVYNEIIPLHTYATGLYTFRASQRLLHSPHGYKRAALGAIERTVRKRHSLLQALSHRPCPLEESLFENRNCMPWIDPFTQTERKEDFFTLYHRAKGLSKAGTMLFDCKTTTLEDIRALTGERNMSGRPTRASIIEVCEAGAHA